MIPDGFQYCLDDFWNFQNVHQIWTRAPRIYDFCYTKNTSKNIGKYMGTSLKHIIVTDMDFKKCQFWRRRAPINSEDPSNEIFKIFNMRPISTWKHEWIFTNMVPISI